MLKRFILALALVSTAAASIPVWAQSKVKVKTKTTAALATVSDDAAAYAATITAADLRQHLSVLASDAFEGRATGEKGQKLAADYLSKQFADLGLQGPLTGAASAYLQPFRLVRFAAEGVAIMRLGSRTFEGLHDFAGFGPSAFRIQAPAAPLFLGFGIETDRYNDYAGQDVKGRDVVVLQGEPTDGRGHFLLSGGKQESEWSGPFRKAALARDKGARSVWVVTFAPAKEFRSMALGMAPQLAEPAYELLDSPAPPATGLLLTDVPPTGLGTYLTSLDMGAALLGTTPQALADYVLGSYSSAKPPTASFKPAAFEVFVPQARQELASENVLGFLEGTDKKDEVLVVSAHYDHVGIEHDTIYNGADDDGSGTSAVLELAQAFSQAKKEGRGPRRSILFLLNAGEERGLLGSDFYTSHPVQPLAQTVADLNIDMVGRTDPMHTAKDRYLYLIGADKLSSELHALSEATNAKHSRFKLDYRYNDPADPEQLYYRSDHYNFARRGVPVIFYTSGLHQDYHKATDDVEKIEFDKLAERARLVFYTAWELANREARPVVDSNKP
ncbi:M28 family peptidase [Hymenobacter busanensis]|uniref:M28 family peptidase n=1 Tax=Hymenobacter busanensis TaxID=2607656 RepID=A0A7L5A047_9BACT|nr:M28 family peptidase [Hymenobacter busanensis]KAA9331492.1 M28 family peptidase [Hymenobacter busanensis]QHJ08647.1 M28 family peptidase [Hymenobacter busanensis]